MPKNDADTIVTTLRELAEGASRLLNQASAKVSWSDGEVYAVADGHLRVAKKRGVEVHMDVNKRMLVLALNNLGCPHRFIVEVKLKLKGDGYEVIYTGAARVSDPKGWIYALGEGGKWYRLSPHFRRAFRTEDPCQQVPDNIKNAVVEAMQPGGALSGSVISSLIDLFCPLVNREKVRPGHGSREEAA